MINYKLSILATLIAIVTFSNAVAKLSVHPGQLQANVLPGQAEKIKLHVTNLGPSASLTYEASSSAEWISFDAASGQVIKNDTIELEITIDASMLAEGQRSAEIIVGDPHHGPVVVPLELNVQKTAGVIEREEAGSPFAINVVSSQGRSTAILSYELPGMRSVLINLHDVNGNFVKSILNEAQGQGSYAIEISGGGLSAGVYFVMIQINQTIVTKKVILNI